MRTVPYKVHARQAQSTESGDITAPRIDESRLFSHLSLFSHQVCCGSSEKDISRTAIEKRNWAKNLGGYMGVIGRQNRLFMDSVDKTNILFTINNHAASG